MPKAASALAFISVLLLSHHAGAAGSAGARLSDDRKAELSRFLTQDCGSCHGLRLTGGLGKPLTVEALRLFSDDDLVATILNGRPGTAMPPWRGVISEADARFIVHLLREGGRP